MRSPRNSTAPAAAVWLQVALAILVLWISDLRDLLGYIGYTLSLSTAATIIGLFVLRRREGGEAVPIPGYPLLPLFFLAVTLATALFMAPERPTEALLGLATLALGLPLYFLRRNQK